MYTLINKTSKTVYLEDPDLGRAIVLRPGSTQNVEEITKEIKFAINKGLLEVENNNYTVFNYSLNKVSTSSNRDEVDTSKCEYTGPNESMYEDLKKVPIFCPGKLQSEQVSDKVEPTKITKKTENKIYDEAIKKVGKNKDGKERQKEIRKNIIEMEDESIKEIQKEMDKNEIVARLYNLDWDD